LVLLLLLAVVVYPLRPSQYGERLQAVIEEGEEADLSAESRPVLWRLAIRMWADHPVIGVGLGNFPLVIDSYASTASDLVTSEAMAELIFKRGRLPHGLYTGMLAEIGPIGLALFLMLVWRNVVCRLNSSNGSLASLMTGAQAGIIGFSTAAIFGDFQYIDALYWQLFVVGAILSVSMAPPGRQATGSGNMHGIVEGRSP
jgi:O-antigen ligase